MSNLDYPQSAPARSSSWAIVSLICGILAWLGVFGLGGLLAVIFGHIAKKEIRESNGMVSGDGLATVGLILGYVNIAISLIGVCLGILFFAGVLAAPACLIPFMNDFNTSFTTTF